MLGPGLRNLDGPVAHIDRLLPHAVDLVAEDQRVFHPRTHTERIEHHGSFNLLHGVYLIPLGAQLRNALRGRRMAAPGHGQLGSQGRFVDVAGGRHGGNAAQGDPFRGESVGRAKKSPDVLGRTDVVQHHRDGHFLHRGELRRRGPAEFFVGDFAHNGFGMVYFGVKNK